MNAADIHARLGPRWPAVLAALGIAETALRVKKPGPCPACAGTDRYTFDNRHGRGDFFCRGCGAGDGFGLLQRVHGWSFTETRRRVIEAAGIAHNNPIVVSGSPPEARPPDAATAPAHVRALLRTACAVADCEDALHYLKARAVWPLSPRCALRAHASAPYFEAGRHLGRFAALIAPVCDMAGETITVHITYLLQGRKLEQHTPRKLLSPLTGRVGCAARLVPYTNGTLGIAEGIETALAAQQMHLVPTWAALNTSLLVRFDPPPDVQTLAVFADRDTAGLEAAARLMERLQGRVRIEIRVPPAPHKDWNDALLARWEAVA